MQSFQVCFGVSSIGNLCKAPEKRKKEPRFQEMPLHDSSDRRTAHKVLPTPLCASPGAGILLVEASRRRRSGADAQKQSRSYKVR